jgi:L-seryl-tRNA(Ser) seleniumtransferase
MQNPFTGWTRRYFLQGVGLTSVMSGLGLRPLSAAVNDRAVGKSARKARHKIYEELGLRPFINAAGTYTTLSACVMPDEVVAAMEEASRQHISIPELHEAAGKRIASLVGSEAALVTSGCAGALTLATAACVCGSDGEKIRRAPDTSGMKNEVIFQKSHRIGYDHGIRNVGVKLWRSRPRKNSTSRQRENSDAVFPELRDPQDRSSDRVCRDRRRRIRA